MSGLHVQCSSFSVSVMCEGLSRPQETTAHRTQYRWRVLPRCRFARGATSLQVRASRISLYCAQSSGSVCLCRQRCAGPPQTQTALARLRDSPTAGTVSGPFWCRFGAGEPLPSMDAKRVKRIRVCWQSSEECGEGMRLRRVLKPLEARPARWSGRRKPASSA